MIDFEEHRGHLRGVAYRMLGSLSEADDAVQETWLRLSRAGGDGIANLAGWLTTVTSRICLDALRSRKSRKEEPIAKLERAPGGGTPDEETQLAASVGLALLVILEHLDPDERVAFVLHDMFSVPFDEIAAIVGKSLDATRQLASRARRRIQGVREPAPNLEKQRTVVQAFMTAARGGDLTALLAVLHPEMVMRNDPQLGGGEVRGAEKIAKRAKGGAQAFAAQMALVDGNVALVVAPRGKLAMVLAFTIDGDRVTGMDGIADPARLAALEIALLPDA
jgi:RNA polymerase sigma-70 factor (ECF subfamily)